MESVGVLERNPADEHARAARPLAFALVEVVLAKPDADRYERSAKHDAEQEHAEAALARAHDGNSLCSRPSSERPAAFLPTRRTVAPSSKR